MTGKVRIILLIQICILIVAVPLYFYYKEIEEQNKIVEASQTVEEENIENFHENMSEEETKEKSQPVDDVEDLKFLRLVIHEDSWYEARFEEEKLWLLEFNEKEGKIDEKLLLDRYQQLLSTLEKEDIQSIRLALKVAKHLSEHSSDDQFHDALFREFRFYFYEVHTRLYPVIHSLLSRKEVDKIVKYDSKIARYSIKEPEDIEEEYFRVVATLLIENGFNLDYIGINHVVSEDPYFLNQHFYDDVSESLKEYLDLKTWESVYLYAANNNRIDISWEDLCNKLIRWERFAKKYPDLDEAKIAKEKAEFYFYQYITISKDTVSPIKYKDGMLDIKLKESYEQFIKNYSDSDYCSFIQTYYTMLEYYNFYLSHEITDFLIENHFEVVVNPESVPIIEEYNEQIEAFKQIKSSRQYISVLPEELNRENKSDIEIVIVHSVEEFFDAIGSNRKILLQPGNYVLDDIPSKYKNRYNGSFEFIIEGVSNMTIQGIGELPVNILIRTSADVLEFHNCENIVLSNVRIGHITDFCPAGVVVFHQCSNVVVHDSILFGCGAVGIKADLTDHFTCINTLITDCTFEAIELKSCRNFNFHHVNFTKNGMSVITLEGCHDIFFDECYIADNKAKVGPSRGGVFNVDRSENIYVKNTRIERNRGIGVSGRNATIHYENITLKDNNF